MSKIFVLLSEQWRWFCVALLIILVDQLVKFCCRLLLSTSDFYPVIPGLLDFVLFYNRGAAFSFFADAGGWQIYFLIAIACLVASYLFFGICRGWFLGKGKVGAILIFSGAFGNAIDRSCLGYVTDFIFLHYGSYYYPAFNIADACITVGALLLLISRPSLRA